MGEKVSLFSCARQTRGDGLWGLFCSTGRYLGEFDNELDVLKGDVCVWERQESESGASLASPQEVDVLAARFAEPSLRHRYRQACLSVRRLTRTLGVVFMCSVPALVCDRWAFCWSASEVLKCVRTALIRQQDASLYPLPALRVNAHVNMASSYSACSTAWLVMTSLRNGEALCRDTSMCGHHFSFSSPGSAFVFTREKLTRIWTDVCFSVRSDAEEETEKKRNKRKQIEMSCSQFSSLEFTR